MSIPGVKIDKFQVPVCNCFRPKNVKDQLCYEADLNVFKKHIDDLKLLSFSLVIDFNEDRVRADEYDDNDDKADIAEENLGVIDKLEKDFIILGTKGTKVTYISLNKNKLQFPDSLKLPIDFNYNLNVVKEIKVTESYLTLEEDLRKCNKEETFDDCANHQYIDTFLKKCNCLPLRLQLKNEVELLF